MKYASEVRERVETNDEATGEKISASESMTQPGDYCIVGPNQVWKAPTVLINCPFCCVPHALTQHTIENKTPLSIKEPIVCPYAKAHNYSIKEGKIIPTNQ